MADSSWVGNHPCAPSDKRPVLVTRELTKDIHLHTGKAPHSSSQCWNMVSSDRMVFGIFQVPPGGTYGPPTDVHVGDEVYYILNGTLTEFNPETGQCLEVKKGEAILLPKEGFHTAYNFGTEELTILFVIAPRAWEEGMELNFEGKPRLYKWNKEEEQK
jgi:mannose-6-phosphate isomerase-like protein (cupin superfamily)